MLTPNLCLSQRHTAENITQWTEAALLELGITGLAGAVPDTVMTAPALVGFVTGAVPDT